MTDKSIMNMSDDELHKLNITTGPKVREYLRLMNNEQEWWNLMSMENAHDRLYFPFISKLNPFPQNYHDEYHQRIVKSRENKVIKYLDDRDAFELYKPGLTMSDASELFYQKYSKPNEEQVWNNTQEVHLKTMKENNLEDYYWEGMDSYDVDEMINNPTKREQVLNQMKSTGMSPYQFKLNNDLKEMGNFRAAYLAGAPSYVKRLYTGSKYF